MKKEEKAHFGQTIRTETSPDKSSHKPNEGESLSGRKMGGGPSNLEHSLNPNYYNDKGKAPGR